jgi:type I restriction enzyme S subunit
MKKPWQTKNLGDLCDVIGGGTPPKENPAFYTGSIPWATVRDMRQDVITETEFRITNDAVERSATNIIPAGNVVMATRVGLGKVCLIGQDTAINQDLRGIVPRNDKTLVVRFLYWWLKSIADIIVEEGTGATVQGVKLTFVKSLQIPVPPVAEQQRIVGILDEAFEGIATGKANAEKNLQNALALFQSHLQSIFTQQGLGSVEKPLGNLCDFLNGFAFKSGDAVAVSKTQLVRMGNLYGNQLDLDRSPVFYPDSFATEHSRYVLEAGDIIMSLTGTNGKEDYGFAVRIPKCGHTLLMNQRIMKFDAIRRDIIDDGYLLHYLRSRCFLDILYPMANGTRQANLSSVTMKLIPVPLRSLQEQKVIATQLDDLHEETQRLATIYERKLAALDELKKSLLHHAFSGRL